MVIIYYIYKYYICIREYLLFHCLLVCQLYSLQCLFEYGYSDVEREGDGNNVVICIYSFYILM